MYTRRIETTVTVRRNTNQTTSFQVSPETCYKFTSNATLR